MKKVKKLVAIISLCLALVSISVVGTLAYLKDKTDKVQNTFTVGNIKIVLDEAPATQDENGDWRADEDLYKVEEITDGRVIENEYTGLLPTTVIEKDPTVFVEEGSVESYLFVKCELEQAYDIAAILAHMGYFSSDDTPDVSLMGVLAGFFGEDTGFDPEDWTVMYVDEVDATKVAEYQAYFANPSDETKPEDKSATVVLGYNNTVKGGDFVRIFEKLTVNKDVESVHMALLENPDAQGKDQGLKLSFTAYAIQAKGFDDLEDAYDAYKAEIEPTVEP